MKKLLIVIFAIGIIAGAANAAFADYPSITLNSENYAGGDYSSGLSVYLEAGTYEFFVESGAWSSSYGLRDWMWNVNIYQQSTATTNIGEMLGSTDKYATLKELNSNLPTSRIQFTINPGEELKFFNYYNSETSRIRGSVVIGVNSVTPPVVPEPVSSVLFVTGGAFLAGRRYLKRKRIDS